MIFPREYRFRRTKTFWGSVNTHWDRSLALNPKGVSELKKNIEANEIREIPEGTKLFFSKSVDFSRTLYRQWGRDHDCVVSRSLNTCTAVAFDLEPVRAVLKHRRQAPVIMGRHKTQFHWLVDDIEREEDDRPKEWICEHAYADTREIVNQLLELSRLGLPMISLPNLTYQVLDFNPSDTDWETLEQLLDSVNDADLELGVQMLSTYSVERHFRSIFPLVIRHKMAIRSTKQIHKIESVGLKGLLEAVEDLPYTGKTDADELFVNFVQLAESVGLGRHITKQEWRRFIQLTNPHLHYHVGDMKISLLNLEVQVEGKNVYNVRSNIHSGTRTE